MSHSPYILPSNGTLHPTGPTIPYTYCISTFTCNINPTIPQNIIQKFAAQLFGTDTSTAIDQCGILFISSRPAHYIPISISPSQSMVPLTGPAHSVPPVLAMSPTGPITTISLALSCLLTGCVQSFTHMFQLDQPTTTGHTDRDR